ncbi:hypothetical protein WR25_10348 [Diploscapter pachys]|uniref:Uncharacterized protein n=1 Tax=Diploscapter pachys TaxID=2018661 RepID=A0A2A2K0E2_9BILA|nr:hypothetical protein WR25_10348 [Diploscapter pachys]
MRTKCVGTNVACVTRYRSIRRSTSSASNRSMTITVPPNCCTAIAQRSGAAPLPIRVSGVSAPIGPVGSAPFTPFGRPVVPEE